MGKSAEEIDFIQVAKTERAKFVEAIQDTTWNTQLRTAAESLLIIYDQMLERLPVDGYREALEKAVEIIKQWHNSDPHSRLREDEKELMWKIYYNQSPEMKPIRAILSSTNNR